MYKYRLLVTKLFLNWEVKQYCFISCWSTKSLYEETSNHLRITKFHLLMNLPTNDFVTYSNKEILKLYQLLRMVDVGYISIFLYICCALYYKWIKFYFCKLILIKQFM